MNKKTKLTIKIVISALSFFLILCCFITMTVLLTSVDPPIKGFYCNDESIRYPYGLQTIPDWALFFIILVVPLVVFICGSCIEVIHKIRSVKCCSVKCCKLFLPFFLLTIWFLMGLGLTGIVISIVKLSVGELRPHFIAVCNPDMSQINCTDQYEMPLYISQYTCLGDKHAIREARLSFPSGYTSGAAYSSVFTAFYISSVSFENWRSPVHLILVIIFALLSPSLVGLTRINDNFHHPHDVIFGIILGGIIAIIVVYYFLYYFNRLENHSFFGNKTGTATSKEDDTNNETLKATNVV